MASLNVQNHRKRQPRYNITKHDDAIVITDIDFGMLHVRGGEDEFIRPSEIIMHRYGPAYRAIEQPLHLNF
jgi:hypothetical protein